MNFHNALQAYHELLCQSPKIDINDNCVRFKLTLNNNNIDLIKEVNKFELLSDLEDNKGKNIFIDDLHDNILKTCTIILFCNKPHSEYTISPTWDIFLSYSDNLKSPCKEILIVEEKKIYTESDSIFNNYLSILFLLKTLQEISEYKSSNEVSFFYNQIFIIKIKLTKENLDSSFSAKFLKEFIDKDVHHEARTILLKETLKSFLMHQGRESRLGYLIKHFDSFYNELTLSYARYVNNHSFSSLKSKYLGKKTEYINKINTVFHDITTKILGIPLGVWLISSQVTKSNGDVFLLMKNILIVVIVISMYIIIFFNFLGQNRTLNAIQKEYQDIFGQLKKDLLIENSDNSLHIEEKLKDINKILNEIDTEASHVSFKIIAVCTLIIIIGVCSIAIAFFS